MLSELDKPDKLFSLVMYDFKKGFDLIDHNILINRIHAMGLSSSFTRWLVSFLQNRRQKVRLPNGTTSSWKSITCGIPQGTLVGPLAFLAMVNGAAAEEENRLKYVDDLTVYQSTPIDMIEERWALQKITDELAHWSSNSKMVLNAEKCQVMHFYTAKKPIVLPDIMLNGQSLPIVSQTKLLGVNLSSDLSWQAHVDSIVKKASKAFYMLHIMKRFQPPREQLLTIYTTYVRPLLEYCAPVFHASLTASQANQIERVQKRALKLIGGYDISYQQLLEDMHLDSLADRRSQLCLRFAKKLLNSAEHRDILPPERVTISTRRTRYAHLLQPYRCGARLRKSSVPYMTTLLNQEFL